MAEAAMSTGARAPGKSRRIGYRLTVGLMLALIVATWAAAWPPDVTHPVTGWLPDSAFDSYAGTFADEATAADLNGFAIHRHHFLAGSVILWTLLIGLAVQLRRPARKQAPLWLIAALPVVMLALEVALVAFDPFTLIFVVLALGALALHPRRLPDAGIVWKTGRGAVAAIGAVALLAYAYAQARLQILGGRPTHTSPTVTTPTWRWQPFPWQWRPCWGPPI